MTSDNIKLLFAAYHSFRHTGVFSETCKRTQCTDCPVHSECLLIQSYTPEGNADMVERFMPHYIKFVEAHESLVMEVLL